MTAVYLCPVCGYDQLQEPPYGEDGTASYEICPSCGVEFGHDDDECSIEELRQNWLQQGAKWWSQSTPSPQDWEPHEQLKKAGILET
ncbi:hypothetical protein Cylst_3394 [Cylindrospermum stagnale PCC 7417]|uniref:Uncharacterized protein n=1 Tax=Cylindrospermum stagnale PCC 7417 TaxID=56107 RepID=K9X0E7_9NOST|nr:hypothetical protein [Cylindrospermum stagnale]AFZ25544.1 hypothetical protein Cylst_3394 [Cylindrospermum stagnale PCC 7417]